MMLTHLSVMCSRQQLVLLPLAAILLLVSCLGPAGCPSVGRAAIQTDVVHSATGDPLEGALVVARDGTFADSALTNQSGNIRLGFLQDRRGIYDVSVVKEGFQKWTRSNIEVDLDSCGRAETVNLEVQLMPE